MVDSLKDLMADVGIILLVLGFFGSAALYLRGSAYKGTIEALDKNVQALKDRVDIQESELRELKADLAERDQNIQILKSENDLLKSQRPSNVILESIVNMLTLNHTELMTLMSSTIKEK